jgi:carbon-monoxide dehydrogenase large subunit
LIGRDIPRVDAYDKVTGKAVYTTDLRDRFPRTLHMAAVRSPHAHAKVTGVDCGAALALPGVAYVLTGQEQGVKWGRFPAVSRPAQGEALWAGQAIAWVAGESIDIAREAAGLIEVRYEPLAHVLNWQDSFKADPASVLDPDKSLALPKGVEKEFDLPNVAGAYYLNTGDVDLAFEGADEIVEEEFWTGKKFVQQMEPAAALAVPTADGGLELYSNASGVHSMIRKSLCGLFDLPAARVRVIQPYTGGSFGNRNTSYMEGPAALMALRTGRPVYYELSREEMFTAAPSAWICASKIRLGAKKDGTFVAKDLRLMEEIGASTGGAFNNGRMSSSSAAALYTFPNARMRTCSLLTNTVPTGSYRGLGAPDTAFALEGAIDRMAERLGMDPLEIRLKNLIPKGGVDDYGEVITSIGAAECLRRVAERIGIGEPCAQDDPLWRKGKGVACAAKQSGRSSRGEAEALYHKDGSVELRVSCDNHGMGATTSLVQIACEELGVAPERIRIMVSDTAMTPYDNTSASSTGVYRTGNAVRLACKDVVAQIREAAARYAGVQTDFVRIEGGVAHIAGSHLGPLPIGKLFAENSPFQQDVWGLKADTPVRGIGVYNSGPMVPWGDDGRSPRMWNWFQYAATAVEIAVNRLTGQIKVLRVANACDAGNAISPKIVEGQLDGAAHMAIGFCINEEIIYDSQGRIANASLGDYRLPMIYEAPKGGDVHSIICPDPLPDGPYGAKGMSESIVSAVGPAIAAALYQAVGVRVNSYPMTAERVLAAMQGVESRKGTGAENNKEGGA